MHPAVAARGRQLAAQAEHRRAIAEFRARRAADQQARINALLLEAIAALAEPARRAPNPRSRLTPKQPGTHTMARPDHPPHHRGPPSPAWEPRQPASRSQADT